MKTEKNIINTKEERLQALKRNLKKNSPDFPEKNWEELNPILEDIKELEFSDCLVSWTGYDECVGIELFFGPDKHVCIDKFIFEDDPEDESRILSLHTYSKKSEEEMKQGYASPWKMNKSYFLPLEDLDRIIKTYLDGEE